MHLGGLSKEKRHSQNILCSVIGVFPDRDNCIGDYLRRTNHIEKHLWLTIWTYGLNRVCVFEMNEWVKFNRLTYVIHYFVNYVIQKNATRRCYERHCLVWHHTVLPIGNKYTYIARPYGTPDSVTEVVSIIEHYSERKPALTSLSETFHARN